MIKIIYTISLLFLSLTVSLAQQGVKALWEDSPSKDEYWLALLFYVNNLNK
jgi:hypothetical protein